MRKKISRQRKFNDRKRLLKKVNWRILKKKRFLLKEMKFWNEKISSKIEKRVFQLFNEICKISFDLWGRNWICNGNSVKRDLSEDTYVDKIVIAMLGNADISDCNHYRSSSCPRVGEPLLPLTETTTVPTVISLHSSISISLFTVKGQSHENEQVELSVAAADSIDINLSRKGVFALKKKTKKEKTKCSSEILN